MPHCRSSADAQLLEKFWGGDIKISQNLGIVTVMAIALTQVAPLGKKRPTQLRNEQRMIGATIDLLATHPVDEVTSRAIAEASSTNVSYIIRYWGSRDAMLAAVADALCSSIVTLIERRVAQVDEDQRGLRQPRRKQQVDTELAAEQNATLRPQNEAF